MWLLTWKFPGEGEFESAPFSNEAAALEEAAAEILIEISSEWDLADSQHLSDAHYINEAAIASNWGQVIDRFNHSDTNRDGKFMLWEVRELVPIGSAALKAVPLPLSQLDKDDDYVPPTLKSGIIVYQATEPGATCRGPHCGTYSEYAYADQADGTFLCYSCKMMISVFGGKP